MSTKCILMVLGGTFHDFEAFAAALRPVLEVPGHSVEVTYDLDALARLDEALPDVVLLYTCLGVSEQTEAPPNAHTPAQVDGLIRWVRAGGGLLVAHSATVAAQSNPRMRALLGGAFIEHPPPFTFTVYPLFRAHPITAGVEAFAVHDELYVQEREPSVEVHMVALDRGVAHPMVWSRSEGEGRVVHIAMGHDERVWRLDPYQRLILQAIDWLTAQ